MSLLLAPSSRMSFSAWLHSSLPSLLFLVDAGTGSGSRTGALEAELMALVAAATDADELSQGLLAELRDFRTSAATQAEGTITEERAARFSAEVRRWLQQQPQHQAQPDAAAASSSASAASAAAACASDEAMLDSQESVDAFSFDSRPSCSPLTPTATPRSSGRKRRERESDDDSNERGEAEGAISGSDSKRRREQGPQLSSPSILHGARRACFEYTREDNKQQQH